MVEEPSEVHTAWLQAVFGATRPQVRIDEFHEEASYLILALEGGRGGREGEGEREDRERGREVE